MGAQAFSGKRVNGFFLDPDDIEIVGLDTDDGPEHPLYDDRIHLPLKDEFVADIDELGIHTPVTVRKVDGKAQCVFGRQRIRGARKVNEHRRKQKLPLLQVPCILKRGEDKRLMAVSFSENANRTQNDPIQEARDMMRLLDQGYDEKQVGIHFGCSDQTVKNRIALLEMSTKVKAAVASGKVSATSALQWRRLSAEKQEEALSGALAAAKALGKGKATGRQTRQAKGGFVRPNVKQLKKMLEADTLSAEVQDFIRWYLGDVKPTKVKGLTKALRAIGFDQGEE